MDPGPTRPQHFQPQAEREEVTPALLDDDQLEYPNKEGYGVASNHDVNPLKDTTAAKLKLPGPNPALDAVLIPALSDWYRAEDDVKHNPERKSIYPSLDGLKAKERILSLESAMSYQYIVINARNAPFDDPSLPGVQLAYTQHVKDLYAAMIDVSVARNPPHSRALKRMSLLGRDKKPHHPAVKLVAKAHAIISTVIDGATNGFRKTKNQGQARYARADDLHASALDRLETMCVALQENKNIVVEVLEGDEQTIINFAYAPKTLMSVRSVALRDSESKVATNASHSQQTASTSPDGSASGDTSGGSELSNTGFNSIYPPFDDLPAHDQLADLQAAKPHLNKAEERDDPLKSDPYLALLKQNSFPLFQKLYGAMTDVTEIQNPPASKEYKWFVQGASKRRKSAFLPVQDIQEVCWRILEEFFDVAEHGFLKTVRSACSNNGELSIPASTTSNRRFASILEVLRREKVICARVIRGELSVGVLLCQPYCLVAELQSGRDRHRRRSNKSVEATADQLKEESVQEETVKRKRGSTSPDMSPTSSRPSKNLRHTTPANATDQTRGPLQARSGEVASLQYEESALITQSAQAASSILQQPATPVNQEETQFEHEAAPSENNTMTTDCQAAIPTLHSVNRQSLHDGAHGYDNEDNTSLHHVESVPAQPSIPAAEAPEALSNNSNSLQHDENVPVPQSAHISGPLPLNAILSGQQEDTYPSLDTGPAETNIATAERETHSQLSHEGGQRSIHESECTDADAQKTVAPPAGPLQLDDELPSDLFVDEDELARTIEDAKRLIS
ncbi:hypothetical protein SLS56_010830 [Neofusicoccum ribis]|uniref:Uncharacterized protein n=1 Tax=Neofusicoccum ribis TaxID=45134 RepID=A0ABR3SDB6_9PEZI